MLLLPSCVSGGSWDVCRIYHTFCRDRVCQKYGRACVSCDHCCSQSVCHSLQTHTWKVFHLTKTEQTSLKIRILGCQHMFCSISIISIIIDVVVVILIKNWKFEIHKYSKQIWANINAFKKKKKVPVHIPPRNTTQKYLFKFHPDCLRYFATVLYSYMFRLLDII